MLVLMRAGGTEVLSRADMKGLFDPIVKQVISLLGEQVRDSNKLDSSNKVSVYYPLIPIL